MRSKSTFALTLLVVSIISAAAKDDYKLGPDSLLQPSITNFVTK